MYDAEEHEEEWEGISEVLSAEDILKSWPVEILVRIDCVDDEQVLATSIPIPEFDCAERGLPLLLETPGDQLEGLQEGLQYFVRAILRIDLPTINQVFFGEEFRMPYEVLEIAPDPSGERVRASRVEQQRLCDILERGIQDADIGEICSEAIREALAIEPRSRTMAEAQIALKVLVAQNSAAISDATQRVH